MQDDKDHAHASKRAKSHVIYRLEDGTRVPGVTTILSDTLPKPALIPWANKLGLEGIEVGKYVDALAMVGTLAHYLIECMLSNKVADLSDYSSNQADLAYNSFRKFEKWWFHQGLVEVIATELPLVSECNRYGGTIDAYVHMNEVPTLIDIKTSKACYPEHYTQVAAYALLLEEESEKNVDILSPKKYMILRVGRNEGEGFEEIEIKNIDIHKERFLICRELYDINRKIAQHRNF